MSRYGVVLFPTTSSAMQAEKTLGNEGLAVKLIPTPRQLSSDCGVALRFDWALVELIKRLLSEKRVEIEAVHQL